MGGRFAHFIIPGISRLVVIVEKLPIFGPHAYMGDLRFSDAKMKTGEK
jgi:hypothetical protein